MAARFWESLTTRASLSVGLATVLTSSLAFAQANPGQVPEAGQPAPTDTTQGGLAPAPTTGDAVDGANADDASSEKRAPGAAKVGASGFRRGSGFALSEDGRSRFHLGADAAIGFDTNPYSQPIEAMLGRFSGDVVTRVKPVAKLNYPGSLIAFDADAFLDYGFLPGIINPQGRNFLLSNAGLGAGLEINRGGMFSVAVRDDLTAGIDPGFVNVGSTFTRVRNDLGGGVGFRPGGGTLLFKLGANFVFEKYFDFLRQVGLSGGSPLPVELLDNMTLGANARVDWRFLPKTGLFAEVGAGAHFYPFAGAYSATAPVSFPVGIRTGIMGNFTSKLSGLASIGYENPLTMNPAGFGGFDTLTLIGVVGQLELQWKPFDLTQLSGGLMRRIQPVPLYQHVSNNRAYLNFSQGLGDDFLANVNVGYSVLLFGRDLTNPATAFYPVSQSGRLDGHLDATIQLAYFLFDWMSFGVSNDLDWRMTNAVIPNGSATGTDLNLSFLRNETLVLMSLYY